MERCTGSEVLLEVLLKVEGSCVYVERHNAALVRRIAEAILSGSLGRSSSWCAGGRRAVPNGQTRQVRLSSG